MSTIASNLPKTSTSPFTGSLASSYTLQLEGDRTIEIGSQPVMIGSGPRCVYRVGTKPVHCVVSLGAEGPVVRRWAEETLLNGESFTEALLSDGDCLSIGSDHFEVHCQGEIDQLDELLEELETLEIEEQAEAQEVQEVQEVIGNATVQEADEFVSEDHSGVEDWLGGKSEWVTPSETPSVEQEADEAVIETETESSEVHVEPQEEGSWAIESTLVEELPVEELTGTDESSLSEEIVAFAHESEHEESNARETSWLDFFTEEEASTVDELEATGADLTDAVRPIDAADTLTIVALRARLAIRAERLRSVVESLRTERAQTETQSTDSLDRIEQLQTDSINAQQQVSESVVLLATLQEELASANERIESLEAELHDAIETVTTASKEEAAHSTEPTLESSVEESSLVEEKTIIKGTVEEEVSIWPDTAGVAEIETDSSSFEQLDAGEPKSAVETPVAVEPSSTGELWGIETLTPEESHEEEKLPEELASTEESQFDTAEVESVEELTGSLTGVLLPGESLGDSPTESVDASLAEEDNTEAIVINTDDDGSSVLASLMTPLSSETQETTEQAKEYVEQESFIDRFAHTLPEEVAEEKQDDSIEISLPASFESDEMPSVMDEQGENEESIDDYMKKMMNRIRGDETPAPVAPKVSQPAQDKVVAETVSVEEEATVPAPEKSPLLNLGEMKRNPTRALGADLGELRQLANQSARRAIDVAETNDRKEHATMRLVVSGVVATCGLLACLTTPSLLSWQLYGGLAGIVAGGYLGFRTVKVIQHSASLEATPINVVKDTDV